MKSSPILFSVRYCGQACLLTAAITATLVAGGLNCSGAERTLEELVTLTLDAAAHQRMDELEDCYVEARGHAWADFEKIIQSVPGKKQKDQTITCSLLAYSPWVDRALETFGKHESDAIRLCVLGACVEKYFRSKQPMPDGVADALVALTTVKEPVARGRALISALVLKRDDAILHKSLAATIGELEALKNDDILVKDLIRTLKMIQESVAHGSSR